MPHQRQQYTGPLLHCFKGCIPLCPHAALGLSDHCLVNLLPAYRQKLKSSKPVLRTVKRWTVEAEQDLQACFELTDWSVLEAAATDLDELTDTVTSYISFCEDMCVPTRTSLTFNNDKPWFSTKLKQLRQAKEDAYRSGEKALYKQAKYTLNREIRVAKKNYTGKLKNSYQVTTLHQCGKAWKPLPATRPLHPAPRPINNWLKTWTIFTVGFKNKSLIWHPTPTLTVSQHSHQHPPPPSPYCFSACNQDLWRRCKQSLQPASKPVLFSYHPSSHWSSTVHWSCVKSPPASNAPSSSLYPRNQKSQDLMTTDLLL